MRNYNGYGGISKLSGKRRKPYMVRITVGWDVKDGKAKQLTKTLGYYATRREAALALAEYNVNPTDLTNKDITLREVYEIWSPKHFEKFPSTTKSIQAGFKKCSPCHNMKMVDIKTIHVQRIIDSLADASLSTQKTAKLVFSKSFQYCIENDILQKDYSEFVKTTASKADVSDKFFTKTEIQKIIECTDFTVNFPQGRGKPSKELNLTDSVIILLYSGLRIGELLNIKVSDVDLENRCINIDGTKTKAAKRVLPIHKEIIEVIKRNMFGEYLISQSDGSQIIYASYLKYFYKEYMNHLGLDGTPHVTRHTFITTADKCKLNVVALKRIVGHASNDITAHYTHKEIDDLIEEMDKFTLV